MAEWWSMNKERMRHESKCNKEESNEAKKGQDFFEAGQLKHAQDSCTERRIDAMRQPAWHITKPRMSVHLKLNLEHGAFSRPDVLVSEFGNSAIQRWREGERDEREQARGRNKEWESLNTTRLSE